MIYTAGVLGLSEDLPIVVEVVYEEDAIKSIPDEVGKTVKEGLMTLELAIVLYYSHGGSG